MVWSEQYSVSYQQIDDDHQYIFRLLNRVNDAVKCADSNTCVPEVLHQLLDYTQTHFRDEEVLMKQVNYPGYLAHHQQHNHLLYQVEDLLDEYRRGCKAVDSSVLVFLSKWIVHHILDDDMKVSHWLRQPLQLV